MMTEWSIREEVLGKTHRWPVIILICLAGALAGWAASRLWPPPRQAALELNVALNIYRWNLDTNVPKVAGIEQFNNPDDYKNWQMANLNTLVLEESVIRETLTRLRKQHPYWSDISRGDLATMLHVYWRNAGKWRLVAENKNGNRAAEAVTVWRNVVLDKVESAILHAQNTLVLDFELRSLADRIVENEARLAVLEQTGKDLEAGKASAAQGLDDAARQALLASAQAAAQGPTWQNVLATAPASGAPDSAFSAWLDQAQATLEQERILLKAQAETLQKEQAETVEKYNAESRGSRGFSAGMNIEIVSDRSPDLTTIRPTGTLMAIGSVSALMALALFWLAQLVLLTKK